MKLVVFQFILGFLFSVELLSAQKHLVPNYVVTTLADTIVADKITYSKVFWQNGMKFKITKPDGSLVRLLSSDIFRIKETRNGKVRMYEMVPFYNERKDYIYYRKMQVSTTGKLSLYYDNFVGDWTAYVRGLGVDFDRYVERFNGFKKLKKTMDECLAFKTEYNTRKKRRFKNLNKMVRFYNQECGDHKLYGDHIQLNFDTCIQLNLGETNRVVRSQKALRNMVQKYSHTAFCIHHQPRPNFQDYILVGNNINTSGCASPKGLNFSYKYEEEQNTIVLDIDYGEQQETCENPTGFDYWLLIPKPTENINVVSRLNKSHKTEK